MKSTHQPLYAQVRTALTDRIVEGLWAPGEALPSEFALAAELGVSQGTVRKALNAMAADNQLERRQGKGTYVPLHTPERALFHFFRFTTPDGTPLRPKPLNQAITRIPVPRALGAVFPDEPRLWRISRRRALAGHPALLEDIYISAEAFPDLGPEETLPNALYPHYQKLSGRSVARAEDFLTAEGASTAVAEALAVPTGTALLKAERTSYDLRGDVLERRVTRALTKGAGYRVSLR
ncbi:MAG: GntR family transcriptional regulator [Pseudomonadota bacterium]